MAGARQPRTVNATERAAIVAAPRRPRFEVIPLAGIEDAVVESVPTDATVTVTVSPVKGIDQTLDVAAALRAAGYRAVPHLAARLVADGGHLDRVRRRGVELPILVGMPGPVDVQRLMRVMMKIGGAEAARFVGRHRGLAVRLGTPGSYRPERLLAGLAPALGDPARRVHGLHLFTFNELATTERWRHEMLERFER